MIYTRPTMQYDWCEDNKTDFMCTYATQQFIRDNKLIYIVLMRSNDAVFGFDNDALWHMHVQERLARDLFGNTPTLTGIAGPIICDPIVWNAGSLHVYERHFKYLEELTNENI
jgi:thymidylate synthase